MNPSPSTPLSNLDELRTLLTRRIEVIGDQKMRLERPQEQLAELQKVSEAIAAWHQAHRSGIAPRLNHYLVQASFQKALAWLDGSDAD